MPVINACDCTLCLSWQLNRWQTFLVRFHFAACFDARLQFCLFERIKAPIISSDTPVGSIVSIRGLQTPQVCPSGRQELSVSKGFQPGCAVKPETRVWAFQQGCVDLRQRTVQGIHPKAFCSD